MPKRSPNFWWDFIGDDNSIVVQSDWLGGESLAVFRAVDGQQYRDAQIEQAEQLIADFKAGRKTPLWGNTI